MIEQNSIARNQHPRGQIRASKQYGGDGGILRDDPSISVSTAEEVISYEYLWRAMELCKRGVLWKDSVAAFWLNAPSRINKLSYQLSNHTYRSNRTYSFYVYSPKKREIVSITFRDRVYQRSLNDNVVYPLLTKSLIQDNTACQIGKGTLSKDKVDECFYGYMRNHICKGSSKKLTHNLLDWYEEQWQIFSSQVLSNRQNDVSLTT